MAAYSEGGGGKLKNQFRFDRSRALIDRKIRFHGAGVKVPTLVSGRPPISCRHRPASARALVRWPNGRCRWAAQSGTTAMNGGGFWRKGPWKYAASPDLRADSSPSTSPPPLRYGRRRCPGSKPGHQSEGVWRRIKVRLGRDRYRIGIVRERVVHLAGGQRHSASSAKRGASAWSLAGA